MGIAAATLNWQGMLHCSNVRRQCSTTVTGPVAQITPWDFFDLTFEIRKNGLSDTRQGFDTTSLTPIAACMHHMNESKAIKTHRQRMRRKTCLGCGLDCSCHLQNLCLHYRLKIGSYAYPIQRAIFTTDEGLA